MREAGYNVELAGNIGRSMALRVAENEEKGDPDWFVLEISSFQLDNMYDFHAHIAVLLNITPDHLDRYGYVMQRYVDAKMRIIRNQTHEDYFIYWADDEHVPNELARREHPARQLPFADHPRAGTCSLRSRRSRRRQLRLRRRHRAWSSNNRAPSPSRSHNSPCRTNTTCATARRHALATLAAVWTKQRWPAVSPIFPAWNIDSNA